MTSPAPLTEAEAAAARALAGDFECSWHVGCDEECRADMARAVVAAARPHLLAEFYEAMADATENCGPMSAEGFRGLALMARQSLSLPASKETPNA